MKNRITRREFFGRAGLTAMGVASLGLFGCDLGEEKLKPLAVIQNVLDYYPERGWEKVYRDLYSFDEAKIMVCSPNCTHNCSHTAFIRNGIVVRYEQVYNYSETAEVSPQWNARSCLKGFTYSRRVYSPNRIRYPMVREGYDLDPKKRSGQRGDGKWRKVSWDEAYALIAQKIIAIMAEDPQFIHIYPAIRAAGSVTRQGSGTRFASVLGTMEYSEYDWYADLPPGHPITTGLQTSDHEANDWRNSRYLIHVGKNLIENKLAEVHWMIQSQERGGKWVVITPDYQATVSRAHMWLPIRPGSDAALALGFIRVVIEEGLYDEDYCLRYTSLPLLVREDTGRYLRAEDVFGGRKDKGRWGDFVIWDQINHTPQALTREDVGEKLGSRKPVLEGRFKITLNNGEEVSVATNFTLQREKVSYYTPGMVEKITTIPKEKVEQVAREYATIKPAAIHMGEGINHWFYQNLVQRAYFLLASLTGNVGVSGGGVSNWSGQYKGVNLPGLKHYWFPDELESQVTFPGYSMAFGGKKGLDPVKVRGGYTKPKGETFKWKKPKLWWVLNANLLNQTKNQEHVLSDLILNNELDTLIVNEIEMTTTAKYADIVLPVPSWVELQFPDLLVGPSNPFVHLQEGIIPPIYDCKQDSLIFAEVAKKIDELNTANGKQTDYAKYFEGYLTGKPEQYLQEVLDNGFTTKGFTVEELRKGAKRLQFKTYPRVPFWEQINESKPFFTKTGRLEFYKEEDRFLELGENLITHKESLEVTPWGPGQEWPAAGNKTNPRWHDDGYRFFYNTPHGRHSVHSSWRSVDWHLIWSNAFGSPRNLDGRTYDMGNPDGGKLALAGEPQIEMHPLDAEHLKLKEGDYVEVYNDRGSFVVRLKLNVRLRPGQVTTYHGWWREHYKKGSWQSVTPLYINPVQEEDKMVTKKLYGRELVEGYSGAIWAPTGVNRDCTVAVKKVEDGQWWPEDFRKNPNWQAFISGKLNNGS